MKKITVVLLFTLFSSLFSLCRAQYSILFNFNGTSGATPLGSLVASGNNLYGMTSEGGYYNFGCVFSFNTATQVYTDLLDFTNANGAYPHGSLICSGKRLYGMTLSGGRYGGGVIFAVDTDGSGYFDMVDLNATSGYNPYGSLLLIGAKLYGMTNLGGLNGDGLIFSIDTNANQWTDLWDFTYGSGSNPYGSLIDTGGKLFGMTYGGGTNNDGTLFTLDTTNWDTTYIDILNLSQTGCYYPYGSLIHSGNKLFGTTIVGNFGLHPNGEIFKFTPDTFVTYTFSGDSTIPYGDLLISGSKLYGMTKYGGSHHDGMIFSLDTCLGTSCTLLNTYILNDSLGANPNGSLVLSGGELYGMTSRGGANNDGVIFKIDTGFVTTTTVSKINKTPGFVNAYPNPGNGIFTVTCHSDPPAGGEESHPIIEIYNVLGEKVYSQFAIHPSPFTIDLSSQPNGIYFYRVLTENGNLTGEGKLVIQK